MYRSEADASHRDIQTDIEVLDGVGEGTRGQVSDAGFRNCRRSLERDAAGCFDDEPAAHHRDGLAHGLQIEIVDEHDVGESNVEYLFKLFKRVDFDLDLDEMPGGAFGALQHRRYSASDGDVIVLDQDRVIEAETMIVAAAAAHGVLLQRAQSGRSLAGADDSRLGMRDARNEGGGGGGDARQMAEKIQCNAFGAEYRPGIAGNRHQIAAALHRLAIACMWINRDLWRQPQESRRDQR